MQPAQPQPQQQAAQPSQLVPQAGWAAGVMYQQQGLPPTSMPGMSFGSMPMSMMTGNGMVPGALNGMLAARMAPGVASGRVGSPGAEGLVYSLPQQDARFHFSDGVFSAAFGGNPGFGGGPPTNDDLLAAFMPGCDEVGGGSSGSAGLFGSGGIFAGMSGLAPSTGGTAGGSSGQRPHQPLRPSPLSNGSSGGSGPNHGSGGGGGGALGSCGGSTAPRPPQPPCNSVSSAMPIASLMFPAGSMQSEGSLPLGPMLRSPPPQQASLAGFQMMQQAATAEQQEQTSQRRPQDGALPLTAQQVQAQHDMQRFLNAEPGQPQQLGTGSGLSGPTSAAAAAAPQKPQSAFTGYCPPSAPQTPGQVPSQAQPQQQMGGMQMGMAQQPPWPMTPQQQWTATQWAASQQQQMMAGGQAPGAAFGQHAAVSHQPQGQAMVPGGQMPAAGFGQQVPQQAAGQPQGSGQPVSGSQQPAVSGQAAPLQQPQQLPPEQQQQMATMLQWQQMQMQQMQAAFAMQQQALASGQQMSFPGAAGMPFGNPYMAQFPMGGGMWPPQLNGQQLMMMQQQAQQQAMQQQALLAHQQAQQQQQQQQQQQHGQASQQLSQPQQLQQPQQQQPQQLAQVPGTQAALQPSLASAHSSGTDFMQQPLQQQPLQPLAPAGSMQNSAMQNSAMPMSGILHGAVSSQRPASQGAGLTLSDAGMAHIKWEYGSSCAPMHGNGSDPGSAGRSDGAAVVPDLIAAGSASGSGQLNVPSMPASALLAGALMPPPHPVGGMPMTRAERVDRYREKKARRTDGGAVRYIARQQNAHRRPRIKGRFVKAGELAEYLAANPGVTVTHAGKLLGHGEEGDTESNAQTDAGDSTAVALSAPAQPAAAAHVVPSASNVSGGVDCPAPPAATA